MKKYKKEYIKVIAENLGDIEHTLRNLIQNLNITIKALHKAYSLAEEELIEFEKLLDESRLEEEEEKK